MVDPFVKYNHRNPLKSHHITMASLVILLATSTQELQQVDGVVPFTDLDGTLTFVGNPATPFSLLINSALYCTIPYYTPRTCPLSLSGYFPFRIYF